MLATVGENRSTVAKASAIMPIQYDVIRNFLILFSSHNESVEKVGFRNIKNDYQLKSTMLDITSCVHVSGRNIDHGDSS